MSLMVYVRLSNVTLDFVRFNNLRYFFVPAFLLLSVSSVLLSSVKTTLSDFDNKHLSLPVKTA